LFFNRGVENCAATSPRFVLRLLRGIAFRIGGNNTDEAQRV
jgi:hypothetical protein